MRKNKKPINLWVPENLYDRMKKSCQDTDSDMSKFIRRAVEEKLEKLVKVQG